VFIGRYFLPPEISQIGAICMYHFFQASRTYGRGMSNKSGERGGWQEGCVHSRGWMDVRELQKPVAAAAAAADVSLQQQRRIDLRDRSRN